MSGPGSGERTPRWRQAFDVAERAIAPPLEALLASEGFAVAVGAMRSAQKAVEQRVERSSRQALHRWNLPAASDVNRVLGELAQLQRQVRDLSRRVENLGVDDDDDG